MGKRRVAAKAPQTPRNRRCKKDAEPTAVTPRQELAMRGLCKEDLFMCSQSADSQIDVKWDCYSPDALHHIKRYRGQLTTDDVGDIRLKLGEESDEASGNPDPLPGLWLADKDEQIVAKPKVACRAKRPLRKRRPRRTSGSTNGLDADELVQQLELAFDRHKEAADQPLVPEDPLLRIPSPSTGSGGLERIEEEPVDKPLGDRIDSANTSTDLFESAEIHAGNTAVSVAKTSATINNLQKLRTDLSVPDNKIDDQQLISEDRDVEEQWSDDDLFENDSLLLKAAVLDPVSSPTPRKTTRLSKRKSSMASPSEPLTKTKRISDSPVQANCTFTPVQDQKKSHFRTENNNIISPLAERVEDIKRKDLNQRGMATRQNCIGISLPNLNSYKAGSAALEKRTVTNNSISKVCPSSAGTGLLGNPILNSHAQSNVRKDQKNPATFKPALNSYNLNSNSVSFVAGKIDVIPSSQKLTCNTATVPNSGRTFKRHNTFPCVTVSPRNTNAQAEQNRNNSNSAFRAQSVYGSRNNTSNGGPPLRSSDLSRTENCANPGLPKQIVINSHADRVRRRSSIESFNTSLTDDILCQLAEPDELLDSQFDMGFVQGTQSMLSNITDKSLSAHNVSVQNVQHGKNQFGNTFVKTSAKPPNNSALSKPSSKFANENKTTTVADVKSCTGSGLNVTQTGRKPSGLEIQPPQSQKASQAGKYQFKSLNSKPSTAKTSRADGSSSNQSRPIVPNGIEESKSVLTRTSVTTSEMKSKGAGNSCLDDSFPSDDDELSNPQVLAMLEEVEIKATQASQCRSPPMKCTPDEIQKKKRAALELRQKRLQLKKKPSRPTARHYKPLF